MEPAAYCVRYFVQAKKYPSRPKLAQTPSAPLVRGAGVRYERLRGSVIKQYYNKKQVLLVKCVVSLKNILIKTSIVYPSGVV